MTHTEALVIALTLLRTEMRRLAPSALYCNDEAGELDKSVYLRLAEADKVLEELARAVDPRQRSML